MIAGNNDVIKVGQDITRLYLFIARCEKVSAKIGQEIQLNENSTLTFESSDLQHIPEDDGIRVGNRPNCKARTRKYKLEPGPNSTFNL